jgi:hypothetical protein
LVGCIIYIAVTFILMFIATKKEAANQRQKAAAERQQAETERRENERRGDVTSTDPQIAARQNALKMELDALLKQRSAFAQRLSDIQIADHALALRQEDRTDELRRYTQTSAPSQLGTNPNAVVAFEVLREILTRRVALARLYRQIQRADIDFSGVQEKVEVRLVTAATLSDESLAKFNDEVRRTRGAYDAITSVSLNSLPASSVSDAEVWAVIHPK